ncbi:MAG: peptide deformylase, partial [Bacillales bacterium]|nr:peptide deformylase [Bacillales bacterium]
TSLKKAYLANGEGCLSVNKEYPGLVIRNYFITIKAYDFLLGKIIEKRFTGYEAIAVQHEYDHLNGILFYEKISKDNPFAVPSNSVSI